MTKPVLTVQHPGAAAKLAAALMVGTMLLGGCGGGGGSTAAAPNTDPGNSSTGTTTPPPSPSFAGSSPADQTVVVGQSALFSVTVAGATGYQWLKNGVAIAGATQAIYHTPAITAADAGAKYSAQVTTAAGVSTSSTATLTLNPNADGSPPASFWGDLNALPTATQVMTFAFLNRSNGKYPDSQLFWKIEGNVQGGGSINEMHSFAERPTFDMPAVSSARLYFFIAPDAASAGTGSGQYFDFIELNIGRSSSSVPYTFNGNTTRVDAFGLKTAIRLRCNDQAQTDAQRGEDYGTFLEDRAVTFQKYLAEVPSEFQATATQAAPYRILEPGAAGFSAGQANAGYFSAYVNTVYANNGITIGKPTPFLNFPDASHPDLEAAIARHVADKAGTFKADGTLVDANFWRTTPSSSFYQAAPANFYARYWHAHGIGGYAYGFPYDDVGGYSSFLSCGSPKQLLVAVGW